MYQIRDSDNKFLIHRSFFGIKDTPYFDLGVVKLVLGKRLSKTNSERVDRLQPGKSVAICKLSSNSQVEVYRLRQDEIDKIDTINSLKAELKAVNDEIKAVVPMELLERKQRLERALRSNK